MIRKNGIIADREGRLVHIGPDILETVVRHDLREPLGYGAGRLEETDVFVVIVPGGRALDTKEQADLERIMDVYGITDEVNLEGGCLVLGAFGTQAVRPLVRTLQSGKGTGRKVSGQEVPGQEVSGQEVSGQEENLLDTVFLGRRVQVSMIGEACEAADERTAGAHRSKGKRFTIQIDGQQVVSDLNDSGSMIMAAAGRKGVRYFRKGNKHRWKVSAGEVLAGQTYPPFWDEQKMVDEGMGLEQILKPEIAALLKGCNQKSGMQSGEVDGQKVLIKPLFEVDERIPFKGWSVLVEEDVAQILTEYSNAYGKMAQCAASRGLTAEYTFGLRGDDEKISKIRYLLQKSAPTNTTILLTGESGTGKTFLAQQIHSHSKRFGGAFIHVNCAAIPYNLIESELFGYEEGAFTGAKKGGKAGYFEMADGGTLFLDEITEMPLSLQGKLLEVLQSKTYFRIGGEKKKDADVRLIAATNKDLSALVREHRFREDLFYRINVFPIELPPLRKRLDSLFSIVTDLLPGICGRLDVDQQVLSMAALEKMKSYHWPGNIRELENVLEKACILSDGRVIQPEDVELEFAGEAASSAPKKVKTLKELRERFEKQAIEEALKRNRGSRIKTAKELAIGKTSLFEKMKKYGIESDGVESDIVESDIIEGGKEDGYDDEFDSR